MMRERCAARPAGQHHQAQQKTAVITSPPMPAARKRQQDRQRHDAEADRAADRFPKPSETRFAG